MKYVFHPQAEKELNEAVHYYNDCQYGLGLAFLNEVEASVQSILSFPKAWSLLYAKTRRCLINRFPYALIYEIGDSQVVILAVMQLNREPDYWKNRLKKS